MNEKQNKFIELHGKMVKGAEWIAIKRRGAGDLARYRLLEREIDSRWAEFTEPEAEEVWRELVNRRELPAELPEIVDLFGGKVLSIQQTAPEKKINLSKAVLFEQSFANKRKF